MECKQLSYRSALTYEPLVESPELRELESQLEVVKYKAETIQAQLKLMSVVKRMKRSQEKCTT
jgi:hypothetical protein